MTISSNYIRTNSISIPYAIITGASGGLGSEFAHILAKMGYGLVLIGQNSEKLQALKSNLYGNTQNIEIIEADLATKDGIDSVCSKLNSINILPSLLILNAGGTEFGDFSELNSSRIESDLNLNAISHIKISKQILDSVKANEALDIVYISSTSSLKFSRGMGLYASAKSCLNTFALSLSNEYHSNRYINISLAFIGKTNTGFAKRSGIKARENSGMDAENTANAIIRGALKHKPVIVFGFKCKLQYHLLKLLPIKLKLLIS